MSDNRALDKISRLSDNLEAFLESKDLFIVFIDLCDSTEFKQFCLENDLPELDWILRQQIFLSRTAKIIEGYQGKIVKTIGDEVLAIFDYEKSAWEIFNCCNDVFILFSRLKMYNRGRFKIFSKVSIDFGECYNGEVLKNQDFDPIGTCVDRCARISKFAEKNEIVFSESFFNVLTSEKSSPSVDDFEKLKEELKGLGEVIFYKYKHKLKATE